MDKKETKEQKMSWLKSKWLWPMVYIVIWAGLVLAFWFGANKDAMGYALLTFYLVLPLLGFLSSIMIGKDPRWGKMKWIFILVFSVLFMLTSYLTFALSNMMETGNVLYPDFGMLFQGGIDTAMGMFFGHMLMLRVKKRGC